jgi:hypothetical protein
VIWIPKNASKEWLSEALGVDSLQEILREVPEIDGKANVEINGMIKYCWENSGKYLSVVIMRQRDPQEGIFKEILVSLRQLVDHFLPNRLWPDQNSADQDTEPKFNTEK